MNNDRHFEWIVKGYSIVAKSGFEGLNIESISRELGKNKSSFYHYFGELDVFKSELLKYHLNQVDALNAMIESCDKEIPNLMKAFLKFKTDFLFHKQLRVNRDVEEYRICFEEVFQRFETAFIGSWANYLNLDHNPIFASTFLDLIAENFLLQITDSNFNYDWLQAYLEKTLFLLQRMKTSLEQ